MNVDILVDNNKSENTVAGRLAVVKDMLLQAVQGVGRKGGDCTLVAVSKTRTVAEIKTAINAGQRVFGENRVQEAVDKWPDLKQEHGDITLHLIGPLQSNKVRAAVKLFDVIEVLDREKLARALHRVMEEEQVSPKIYVQVNTGEEEQKAGVLPSELGDFLNTVRDDIGLPVEGLMCIPPQGEEPAMHFALLKNLSQKFNVEKLSMGMSGDFDVAAKLGATSVRVGTKIFGARDYTKQ
ncbi:MAG: YggS family pyridoxal phosphate-dependent enzyme [Sphingomonadales bacterium]|nr:YggS family pyridoxal phosphate-dependent enzyme [Sphingomonadales bacterium]